MAEVATFTFEVDQESDVPIWVQLRQRLIFLINSGVLRPGDQLPTVRGLASDISINYNTVNKAYLSLVTDGYLESARGRGVFVKAVDKEEVDESSLEVSRLVDDFIASMRELGLTLDDIQFKVLRRLLQLKHADEAETAVGDAGAPVVEGRFGENGAARHTGA